MGALTSALRLVEHHLLVHRRNWKYLLAAVGPVSYLGAIGVGLGTVIDRGSAQLEVGSYLEFVAPGLLAATAMQTAANQNSFPVAGAARIGSTFDLMLMTPLRAWHLAAGQLVWTTVNLLVVLIPLYGCAAAVGATAGVVSLLALPAAVLTGLAFGPAVAALSAGLRGYAGIPVLLSLVITPLFLLGGAFFPIQQLPSGLQLLAALTPLHHGVELTRGLATGSLGLHSLALHVGVLVLYVGVGYWLSQRVFTRKLVR